MTALQTTASVKHGELLARVRELRPLIESNRRWAHENARMAPAVLEACREAGVFTLVAPRELGGADVELPELYAIFEELGYSDPSVAWHTGNSFAIAQNLGKLDVAVRERLLDGPRGPFGFSGIPAGIGLPVDGGYRLSGRWQFLTGSRDAPWSWLFGYVHEANGPRLVNGQPDLRAFIVPGTALATEPTWDAALAMRGTGSHAVSVEGLFVAEEYTFPLLGTRPALVASHASRWPLYASSPVSNAANALGIARRMVDEAITLATSQKPRMDYTPYADRTDIHRAIARAKSTVEAHSAGFAAMAHQIQEAADVRAKMTVQLRARMWSTFWGAMDAAREVANEMVVLGTSKLYSQANLMDLCFRDLHAIATSSEAERQYQEAAGRVFMGMPPGMPIF